MVLLLFQLALPNLSLTPGVARGLSTSTICSTRWGHDRRHVTEAMKREVARRYGMRRSSIKAAGAGRCCEFDHLISRELGGADDVNNLWPQPWAEARQKDALENRLHRAVCTGRLTLEAAQLGIATNWPAAYRLIH